MLSPKTISSPSISSKVVYLTGGLNERVSNIEMAAGELTECINYEELEGLTHGYTSTAGYERFDGQSPASSVGVVTDDDGIVTDDTAREVARALILEVPGDGPIRGIFSYKSKVYAFRNGIGETDSNMYVESGTGWTLVSNFTSPITATVDYTINRYSLYASNAEVVVWVDGANGVQTFDGTTVSAITMPAGSSGEYLVGSWKNRLFVAVPEGHLLFSALGDPTDWTTASVTGEIYIGEDITTIISPVGGTLLVSTKNSMQVIYYESTTEDFIFRMEEFSNTSGMIQSTAQRMLGTVYFADDRGVTTLEATDAYGDYSSNTLAKKVHRTYEKYKDNIIGSITKRDKSQFILYFSAIDSTIGLVFSFEGTTLKGATLIQYPDILQVVSSSKDEDNTDVVYFGASNGFVYKMDSGTSFDGKDIATRFATSFHSYGTPANWKNFRNILFEVSAEEGLSVLYRPEFDYLSSAFPATTPSVVTTASEGSPWGSVSWSSFTWGSAYLTQLSQKIVGYGTNMRLVISTTDKYKQEHTMHNFVCEYTNGARRI